MPRFRMHPLRANNVQAIYRMRQYIDLDPPYQLLAVWDREKKQRFIDSVINGVDTPKLYFHDLGVSTDARGPYRYSVIDGKQRMLALWDFISNGLPLPGDFVYFDNPEYKAAGLTYGVLLNEYPLLRAHFDDFKMPIIVVEAEDDEFIEQLFWRLNVQMPLSAAEKRNVLGGPLPLLIRKIGLKGFFSEAVRVGPERFLHYDIAAKFIRISLTGGFVSTKKDNLDKLVDDAKAARERGDDWASTRSLEKLERRIETQLEEMSDFFGAKSPLLRGVGRVTLYYHIFRLQMDSGKELAMTLKMLERFNADVADARHKSQRMSRGSVESLSNLENLLLAFDAERQSPNDGGALERQYGLLKKYMIEKFGVDLPEAT